MTNLVLLTTGCHVCLPILRTIGAHRVLESVMVGVISEARLGPTEGHLSYGLPGDRVFQGAELAADLKLSEFPVLLRIGASGRVEGSVFVISPDMSCADIKLIGKDEGGRRIGASKYVEMAQ